MANYKIIRVCIPYNFISESPLFLDFLQSSTRACKESYFPLYLLVNKESLEIIESSYTFKGLFIKLQKITDEEKEDLKKKILRINLKVVDENKKTIDFDNYTISTKTDLKDKDDIQIFDNLRVEIIKHLVTFTEKFRIQKEKLILTSKLGL